MQQLARNYNDKPQNEKRRGDGIPCGKVAPKKVTAPCLVSSVTMDVLDTRCTRLTTNRKRLCVPLWKKRKNVPRKSISFIPQEHRRVGNPRFHSRTAARMRDDANLGSNSNAEIDNNGRL
ncbi:hypothetical protein HBI56_136630 [Parastagonospora nodorum]|nr:hypothetical protein HBH52_242340 [Parastagonospora nodorum]KAH3990922.1 hypothetical protein HBI10_240780 [Parastagonospora nodorum]KAH4032217.1 hypothetical protein HBI13_021640 [Parastagonospora nodorum]KAH4039422.1 hypothetical protein HBI09_031770 [Parastagonospora nodorum]KAH4079804.1 hypothetical protein HBH46_232050 [Parastagonospora nodorum]